VALQVQGFGAILPCDGKKIAVVTFSIGEAFRRSRIPTHPWMEWSEETTCLFRAIQSDELILRFRDVARGAGPPYLKLATRAAVTNALSALYRYGSQWRSFFPPLV